MVIRKAARSNQTVQAAWRRSSAAVLMLALVAACNEAQNKFVQPPLSSVGVSVPLQAAVTPYLELTGTMAAYASVTLVGPGGRLPEGYRRCLRIDSRRCVVRVALVGKTVFVHQPYLDQPVLYARRGAIRRDCQAPLGVGGRAGWQGGDTTLASLVQLEPIYVMFKQLRRLRSPPA